MLVADLQLALLAVDLALVEVAHLLAPETLFLLLLLLRQGQLFVPDLPELRELLGLALVSRSLLVPAIDLLLS